LGGSKNIVKNGEDPGKKGRPAIGDLATTKTVCRLIREREGTAGREI